MAARSRTSWPPTSMVTAPLFPVPRRALHLAPNGPMHLSTEEILEGHAADAVVEELGWNPGQVLWYPQAHLAGSGKGIALHVIDVERPTFALIGAGNLFVRLVPAAVDAIEEKMEIIEGRHIFDGQFTPFVFSGQLLSPARWAIPVPDPRTRNSAFSSGSRSAVIAVNFDAITRMCRTKRACGLSPGKTGSHPRTI